MRLLRGTNGFEHGYAGKADDLASLAADSSAGAAEYEPYFVAFMASRAETRKLPVMELLRACGAESATSIPHRENRIAAEDFELVQDAIAESIVPIVCALHEQLPAPAERLELCARAIYTLRADEHEALIAHLNERLNDLAENYVLDDDEVTVELLHERWRVEKLVGVFEDEQEYLPALVLRMLQHAVAEGLDTLVVEETSASVGAGDDFWKELAADAWDELDDDLAHSIEDSDELFAASLATVWSGDRADAGLRALHARGDERSCRWLRALGFVRPLASFPLSMAELAEVVAGERRLPARESSFVVRVQEPVEERIGQWFEKARTRTARDAFLALGEYLVRDYERMLEIDPDHPTAREIGALLRGDFEALERSEPFGDRSENSVDLLRRARSPWEALILFHCLALYPNAGEEFDTPLVLYAESGAPHEGWGFSIEESEDPPADPEPDFVEAFRCEHGA